MLASYNYKPNDALQTTGVNEQQKLTYKIIRRWCNQKAFGAGELCNNINVLGGHDNK